MHRRISLGVASLAAATLLLETTLTRLLAVAQFYHFAFLVVSLALLGFGASGSLLALVPRLGRIEISRLLAASGVAFVATAALAYAAVNLLPLDTYSIAWDPRQVVYFVLYYLALTLPFLSAGLGIGAALAATSGRSHLTYASNLFGSAAGVLLAPVILALGGVPVAILAACLIALAPALLAGSTTSILSGVRRSSPPEATLSPGGVEGRGARVVAVVLLTALSVLTVLNLSGRGVMGLTLSPYKGLVHAQRYPGSSIVYSRWNALSRVDVVANAGTRQLPGLSYTYTGAPPEQLGLALDADAVQPIPVVVPEAFAAGPYMPEAIAFELRPAATALVLEPAGGLGVLQALNAGASRVTAVIGNDMTIEAVGKAAGERNIYADPRVQVVSAPLRSFLASTPERYDLVFLPLTDGYRPVASGAYSLAETYGLTYEAMQAALGPIGPGGILVVTRWMQTPPSEDLRLLATLHQALLDAYLPDLDRALVAYRGIQTITALVKPAGWRAAELEAIRSFAESRRYDLVAAPGLRPDEINRFNRMPSPELYRQFKTLIGTVPGEFYPTYPYAVEPATDDRPFFFHFFRWGQTREVLATLGRTWQPFGGSGYLVLFALLALVSVLSAVLILAPTLAGRAGRSRFPPEDFPPEDFPQEGFPQEGFPQEGFPQEGVQSKPPERNTSPQESGGVLPSGGPTRPERSTFPHENFPGEDFPPEGMQSKSPDQSTPPQEGGGVLRSGGPRRPERSTFPQEGAESKEASDPQAAPRSGRGRALLYFGLLGVAFLFVEIPLIQRWILVAGHATYAFTGVVLIVLLGSGVGSLFAPRLRRFHRPTLLVLAGLAMVIALLGGRLAGVVLAWPAVAQWATLALTLLPLAVLMGAPFPLGLAWLEEKLPGLTPLAWAVNGCASVIASVTAAILAISVGFTAVLALGAACYALAAFALPRRAKANHKDTKTRRYTKVSRAS